MLLFSGTEAMRIQRCWICFVTTKRHRNPHRHHSLAMYAWIAMDRMEMKSVHPNGLVPFRKAAFRQGT